MQSERASEVPSAELGLRADRDRVDYLDGANLTSRELDYRCSCWLTRFLRDTV